MSTRFERVAALGGFLTVILWVAGVVLAVGLSHQPAADATDAQVLAWVKAHSNIVTGGAWIYMIGCACFPWFAGGLRSRLASAEGGTAPVTTVAFVAAVATGVVAMGLAAPDMAAAIGAGDITAGAAGALHQMSTVFFVMVELGAATMVAGFGVAALRSRALPKWWAIVSLLLGVLLVVGPIGWLGVMFGMPLWTLLSAVVLLLHPSRAAAPAPAPAAA